MLQLWCERIVPFQKILDNIPSMFHRLYFYWKRLHLMSSKEVPKSVNLNERKMYIKKNMDEISLQQICLLYEELSKILASYLSIVSSLFTIYFYSFVFEICNFKSIKTCPHM